MKTLKEVVKQIESEREEAHGLMRDLKEESMKRIRKLRTSIIFLSTVQKYLETSPNEAFIKLQLKETDDKMEVHEGRYLAWLNAQGFKQGTKELKAKYEKEFKYADLRAHAKILNYILA